MLPSGGILEKARKARDARFDGRFFIAVRTTGIYCRPVCPVRLPHADNVTFFESAAAASEAGFRPCLRCRPESSPGTPAWRGTSTTVSRALRLINEGALDNGSVSALSDRLGVTSRHLARLFTRHLGASPKAVAQTRRLQFAKKLIDETNLSMTEIALSSGYGSVRRFNDHFAQVYGRSPTMLRSSHTLQSADEGVRLRLAFRPPFDFPSLLSFFAVRATPGVEGVDGNEFWRNFSFDDDEGQFRIKPEADHLVCDVRGGNARSLMALVQGIRRMFDLDAVPQDINDVLMADPLMADLARQNPGQRLPGSFNPFETCIRAIVGQQVSVKGATTVMGRIAGMAEHRSASRPLFPPASRLAEVNPSTLPMPEGRALAIREFSRQVARGELTFDLDDEEFIERVVDIRGIGPWTASYMSMRALGNPDAFLQGDLVIRRVMQRLFSTDNETAIVAAAEKWRPWRGYAGMHLWRQA